MVPQSWRNLLLLLEILLNGGGWLWLDWISLSQSRFGVNKVFNILSLCLQSFEALNFYKFLDTFENREGFKLDFKIFSLILKNKNIFNGKIIFFLSSQKLVLLI